MRRVLVIGRGLAFSDGPAHQVMGILENRRAIEAMGYSLSVVHVDNVDGMVARACSAEADDVCLLVRWTDTLQDLSRGIETIRQKFRGRIHFIDTLDQSCSPYWPLLNQVDRYLKGSLLRSTDEYVLNRFRGGYVFTDFVSRELGYDILDWDLSSIAPREKLHRIRPFWNWAGIRYYGRLATLGSVFAPRIRRRPVDINVRFSLGNYSGKSAWYTDYRRKTLEILEGLKVRTTLPDRVSRKRYLLELAQCKIVVSPFGWGEVCFRDYEAAAAGALLIKPDVGHLRTEPDIFRPGLTYVPVRWDLSDLADKVRYYLQHPDEAQEIADRANQMYLDFFRKRRSVDLFTAALDD